jgi:peptidyl-prolyl cis-trans isomerase D
MMITRFHKLIQSKTIWYIVLGVVVVSFVGFFTPSIGQGSTAPKNPPAGRLFGKKVTSGEYYRAMDNTYKWLIITSGQMVPMSDQLRAMLKEEAWRRIAVLRKAQAEKTPISNEEILRYIQSIPLFHNDSGSFDRRIFDAVIRQLDLTPRMTEEIAREQILIEREISRPAQAALVSPFELNHAYHIYTDRFVVDYVVVPRAQIEKEVSVSADEVQALYDRNPEAFRMPAKVRVSYVELPIANFLSVAQLPEDAARRFYEANLERYRVTDPSGAVTAEYKPFEQVEKEITAGLTQAAARKAATDRAAEFVANLAAVSESTRPDFAAAAAAAQLQVKTLPAFGIDDDLGGIDPAAPFRQAAFSLQNDAYSSFSDAVVGETAVYVLSLEQRYPAFVPPFDSVKEDVKKAAREQAVIKALALRATEIRDAVAKALESGTTFKSAVAPFGLKIQTPPEFDFSSEINDPYAEALSRVCPNARQGELCELFPVKEGVLLANVRSRQSLDAATNMPQELRQELIGQLSGPRAQRLVSAWQATLLKDAEFENLLERPTE